MDILFKEFELDMLKNDHMFECAYDRFAIKSEEIFNMINEGYYKESSTDADDLIEEAAADFIKSVKAWFDNMIEKVKLLIQEVVSKIKVAQEAKKVNKYLTDIKKWMANNRSIVVNKKIKVTDTAKYFKAYTGYIDLWVKGIKEIYSKKWDNFDEYTEVLNKFKENLEKYTVDNQMNDIETATLTLSAKDCLTYTEKELANQKSIYDAYWKKWKEGISIAEQKAEDFINDASGNPNCVGDIKKATSKLTSVLSKGLKKIATNKNAMALIGALSGYIIGFSNGNNINDKLGIGAVGSLAGSAVGIGVANIANKKLNVDNDQTTKSNMDNDAKAGDEN